MKKLLGGYIFNHSPWEEEEYIKGEQVKITVSHILLWGKLIKDPIHHLSKKGNGWIELGVVAGKNGPGEKMIFDCVAKLENYIYAKGLKQGDWVAALGTWRQRPYVKSNGEKRIKNSVTIAFFLPSAAYIPPEMLRPMSEGEPDVFESDGFPIEDEEDMTEPSW